jgi:hypothetical protein
MHMGGLQVFLKILKDERIGIGCMSQFLSIEAGAKDQIEVTPMKHVPFPSAFCEIEVVLHQGDFLG